MIYSLKLVLLLTHHLQNPRKDPEREFVNNKIFNQIKFYMYTLSLTSVIW